MRQRRELATQLCGGAHHAPRFAVQSKDWTRDFECWEAIIAD
jgi:hypothetical protein